MLIHAMYDHAMHDYWMNDHAVPDQAPLIGSGSRRAPGARAVQRPPRGWNATSATPPMCPDPQESG